MERRPDFSEVLVIHAALSARQVELTASMGLTGGLRASTAGRESWMAGISGTVIASSWAGVWATAMLGSASATSGRLAET